MSSQTSSRFAAAKPLSPSHLLVGVLYSVFVLVVARIGYWSELNKLRRGAFSDTVSPTVFLELATLPGSLLQKPDLPRYPVEFDFEQYRHVVSVRTSALIEVGLVQRLAVCLVSAALILGYRQYHRYRHS